MTHSRGGTDADSGGAHGPAAAKERKAPSHTAGTPAVTARRTIHKGRKFDFEIASVRQGGKVLDREVVRHPGAVTVLPVLDDGRLILVRNFRFAVEQRLLECCAGTIERGEEPARCAERELIEETGYRSDHLIPLGAFYTTPGMTDERMHAFVATNLSHVGQALEEDESIDVETLDAAQVLDMIDRGEIVDGKSIATILMAERRGLLRSPAAGGYGHGGRT